MTTTVTVGAFAPKIEHMVIAAVWKRQTARFQNGWNLYVGRWHVASASFDATYVDRTKTEVSVCLLPRHKPFGRIFHESIDLAKRRAELEVRSWFMLAHDVQSVELTVTTEGET